MRLQYVIVDERGRFYHFFDRANYGEPQFGDRYNAKVMSPQGCGSALRMLLKDGYKVTRKGAESA
jgi:hypothetical protein